MVNGIIVNGVYVNTPGSYGEAYFPPVIGNTVPLKSLAVYGEYAYLPKATPIEITSQEAFDRLMPGDLEHMRQSSIIYAPSNDDRVPGGPASVWLINARPTTQAHYSLLDGAGEPAIKLLSSVWGPKGNQTYVTLAEDAGVYEISISRDGVTEPFTGISGDDLFSVQYVDTDLTTCVAAYTPGGDFVISGTKTAIALGTLALSGHPWDGVVTVTPSTAPAGGQSFTAVVEGFDLETGESATETLTWASGESSAKSTTRRWSTLTEIEFTATAGTPTFLLAGEILRAEPSEVPTVASLVSLLSSPPYGTAGVGPAFTVTAVSSLVGSIRLDAIDPIAAATDIKTSALTVRNVVQTIVATLGASTLVTAEAVAGGGAPVDVTNARLVGGSAGSTQSTDWDAAFQAGRSVPGRVGTPLTDQASIHLKARNHANHMAGPGAYDCNFWVGATKQETLAQLAARTAALNSRMVSLVAHEIERPGPLGTMEWLDPKYLGLMCAAMQCGTREPITAKVPGVNNYRNHASWSSDADRTEAHNKRITILGRSLEDGGLGQIRILRALTTYMLSSDPCRTDVRPVESIAELLIFTRSYFRTQVGTNTTTPTNVIEQLWRALLKIAKDLGIIQDYSEASAKAIRVGNKTTLKATVVPVFSNDFFVAEIGVVPSLGGFQFQLAA